MGAVSVLISILGALDEVLAPGGTALEFLRRVSVRSSKPGEISGRRETNLVLNVDSGVNDVDGGSLASAAVVDVAGGASLLVGDAAEAPGGTFTGLEGVGVDLSVLLDKCNLVLVSHCEAREI